MRAWGLLALAGCACQPQWPPRRVLPPLAAGELSVFESQEGDIVATDLRTGLLRWRFRRPPEVVASYAVPRPTRLLCPMLLTPDGIIVLRYADEVHGLGLDGALRWRFSLLTWPGSRAEEVCGAVAPNSSVVFLVWDQQEYVEITSTGEKALHVDFSRWGVAQGPPSVAPESGDVLIRTTDWLLSVNPKGEVNWTALQSAGAASAAAQP